MTLHSMTGYAFQQKQIGESALSIELKTLNSRFSDIRITCFDEIKSFEITIRGMLQKQLKRGKIDCKITLKLNQINDDETANYALLQTGEIHQKTAEQLAKLTSGLANTFPQARPLSIYEILQYPGILEQKNESLPDLENTVLNFLEKTIADLCASRSTEGKKIRDIFNEQLEVMTEHHQTIAGLARELPKLHQEKLQQNLEKLLPNTANDIAPERLHQEIAFLATKSDITEELNRLKLHMLEFSRVLKSASESTHITPIGKKLDFLTQELMREANTVASKSTHSHISSLSVELKLLIEKIREQVQNIE